MTGRWPANTILTHLPWCPPDGCAPGCVVAQLDAQSGELHTQDPATRDGVRSGSWFNGEGSTIKVANYSDDPGTGASRYFPIFRYTPEDFDLLEPDSGAA